ncbi:MAG: hypothetical protein M3R71_04355, partial [Actinomycetota bacterium]|nr:hypothetical protein [Actinomycetota bacterium]
MADARYVLLGLAQARAPWFTRLSQLATSASVAAEFIKCLSAEEVRARLSTGRAHSALLIDSSLAAFDRDLVATAVAGGVPVFVVTDGRGPSWSPEDIGVAAVLPAGFGRAELLGALGAHATMVSRGDQLPPLIAEPPVPLWRG